MGAGAPMPISVCAMAFAFCTTNSWVQCTWLCSLHVYDAAWLSDPRFAGGLAVFAAGALLNVQADGILRGLRKPGETGYKIPYGGLFRYVSGANYAAEIVEWCGFAVASWSYAGATFALFTFANVAPRAAAHHAWYLRKFDAYKALGRSAVIPGVW
jgi:3-oxo-5-alpha-steroid 4-dehydrogenase 1